MPTLVLWGHKIRDTEPELWDIMTVHLRMEMVTRRIMGGQHKQVETPHKG
jgi:hypothetical protein